VLFRLVAILSACLFATAESHARPAAGCSEHSYVEIGGIPQWLIFDGEDCAQPVVLFVHGGPGNPISPYMNELYGSWKKTFTIATWDQRLSGKTYARNEPVTDLTEDRLAATTISIEQLVSDGIEVAEYLQRKLGKKRIILSGSSWGSVLGVHMAKQRPDLFHAYVGVAQLVNYRSNLAASYEATLEIARRTQDTPAIATLGELGPPPWKNPRNFGRLRRIPRGYENSATTPGPAFTAATEYASEADRAAYAAGEEISFVKYVGMAGDGMSAHVDLPALGPQFELPMFLIQGEQDLLTRPAITRAWFDSLRAPRKKLVMVQGAGHDPNYALIDAQFSLIREEIGPQAR